MDIPGYISLTYWQGLLPGLLLIYLFVRRLRYRNFWRILLLAIAVVLLCFPAIIHTSKSLDLYVLADRSRSISEEGRTKQLEVLELIAAQLKPGDRLGVISFNEKAHVEQITDSASPLKSFGIPYSQDASDLAEGMQLALSQVRKNRPTRILVLSDGEYTGQDPSREAHVARQMNVPIYYRNLKRIELFNLAVRDAETPDQLLANEPYRILFRVTATNNTPGRYRLYRDGRVIGSEKDMGWHTFDFKEGENSIPFTDSLRTAGIHSYKLEVEPIPAEKEKLLSDNYAERFLKVVGERPILLINYTGGSDNIAGILSAGGLQAQKIAIGNFHLGINQLAGYKGIILNNVPILGLSLQQIKDLRNFVLEEGGGLLITGGNRSFSAGGYYKSELDTILPVSLENRQQSKKVSTAFSIVMDRSGSMAIKTPSGEQKIALANAAVVECISLMSGADSLSVIAVDSIAHVKVPQQPVKNPDTIISDVRRIDSGGGGIFTYTGLLAAGAEIVKAPQLNKHILLFADSADAEEPGDYIKLLADYEKAGITVSVVGLGTESDRDAEFLKDVARRGKGTVYFTQDADQLAQFFTADTISYTRNSFVEDSAPMQVKTAAYAISPQQQWKDFTSAGYNLLFSRPKSDVAILTADEDRAPTLASWQQGLGRVAALALDAEGQFVSQPQYGDIILSTARWIMGSNVQDNLQIKVNYAGNYGQVQLEVSDEERQKVGSATLSIFTPAGKTIQRPLNWDSPNRLAADLKLTEPGCYRGVIQLGGETYRLPPMSIPVSPEFLHDHEPEFGRRVLSQLAVLSGGGEAVDIGRIFDRKSRSAIVEPVMAPFLIAFIVLLLLEIAEPRFGLLALIKQSARRLLERLKGLRRFRPAFAATGGFQAATGKPRGKEYWRKTVIEESSDDAPAPASEPITPNEQSAPADMAYLSRSKSESNRLLGDRASFLGTAERKSKEKKND